MFRGRPFTDRQRLAVLAAILFVLCAVWTSNSFLSCERIEAQRSSYQQQQESSSYFSVMPLLIWNVETRCNGAFIDANANAIIAIFTIFLAISTIGLWLETERLAAGADDQSKKMTDAIKSADTANIIARDAISASQRAWLGIAIFGASATWDVRGKSGLTLKYEGRIRNYGQTPALRVLALPRIFIAGGPNVDLRREHADLVAFQRGIRPDAGDIIFPNQDSEASWELLIDEATIADWENMMHSQGREKDAQHGFPIVVCGAIGYGSPFSTQRHVTEFQVRFFAPGNTPIERGFSREKGNVFDSDMSMFRTAAGNTAD